MTAFALPAPARRLSLQGGLRNTFTLTWRSVLKIRTNMEDVLGLSLNPIMFLVLFTYVFGGAVSGGTHRYLQFELPGILVLSVVFATLGTGLMLNQDIASGVFDRFRSLPIARWAPLAGAVLGDMVRYMISVAGAEEGGRQGGALLLGAAGPLEHEDGNGVHDGGQRRKFDPVRGGTQRGGEQRPAAGLVPFGEDHQGRPGAQMRAHTVPPRRRLLVQPSQHPLTAAGRRGQVALTAVQFCAHQGQPRPHVVKARAPLGCGALGPLEVGAAELQVAHLEPDRGEHPVDVGQVPPRA